MVKKKVKGFSHAAEVKKEYPSAAPIKVGKLIFIRSDECGCLGKGKNNRSAWVAAYRNIQ